MAAEGDDPGGGELFGLEHIDDVGPVDPHELRAGQQRPFILAHGGRYLVNSAVGHVEEQVFAVDLHIAQLGKGQTHQHAVGLDGQAVLRLLLPQIQLVQHRIEQLGIDGLEQILRRPDAVAFVGEAGRGGEKDNVRRCVEGTDLPCGVHAGHAGHQHVQQVQGEALGAGSVQQLAAAAEGLKADIGVQVRLPGLQKRRELFQLLDLIITYRDIHGAASSSFFALRATLFYHKKKELSPQNLHFTGVCTHFAAYTSPNSSTSGTMSFAGTTVPCGRGRLRMKWVIWLVAIASTSALVVLWFWEVRRLLRQHRSMVESARCQLAAFEKRAAEAAGNADVAEVLRRSESIYRQAAGNYNETLHRPWIYIPGRLMGFHYEEAAKVPGRVHR